MPVYASMVTSAAAKTTYAPMRDWASKSGQGSYGFPASMIT